MEPFQLSSLLWPAVVIFVVVSVATFRFTGNPVAALMAAFFKSGLYVVYFGALFDGTYTVIDDWGYLTGASELLRRGVTVPGVFRHWNFLVAMAAGPHVLYYVYNVFAFGLFGYGYYAPVACNVILTVAIAWLGARLAERELPLTKRQGLALYLFLLVHPDITTWSTVINAKDILVLWTHVVVLYSVAALYRRRYLYATIVGLSAVMLLFFLRFYVPILFLAAFMLHGAIRLRSAAGERARQIVVVCVAAGVIGGVVGVGSIPTAIAAVREDFVNPLFGIPRFMLTPVPFRTSPQYGFLVMPAVIHWTLMPFLLWGAGRMWRSKNRFTQFFLIYCAVFVLFYGVYAELQGPRHRVQLDYAWGLLQFLGLTAFGKTLKPLAETERRNAG